MASFGFIGILNRKEYVYVNRRKEDMAM
jgi:hypothetical protein